MPHCEVVSLAEYGDLLSPLDVEDIQQDMVALKESLDSVDPDELKLAIANLEQSAYRIADAMYADAAEADADGDAGPDDHDMDTEDSVSEAPSVPATVSGSPGGDPESVGGRMPTIAARGTSSA